MAKLQEFHRVHNTPIEQTIGDLHEAFVWLPKSTYADEAKPLAELVRKQRRGPRRIGDLMIPLLIRLGVVPRRSTIKDVRSSGLWLTCSAAMHTDNIVLTPRVSTEQA